MKKGKIIILLLVLLAGIAAVCLMNNHKNQIQDKNKVTEESGLSGSKEEKSQKEENNAETGDEDNRMLPGDIEITEFGAYIGSYVEDGTDEFVENVAMIVLENQGEHYIQLANVTINDQYTFEVTTLFPGEKVLVLEKNRCPYEEGTSMRTAEISDVATFQEIPTMCEDILKVDVQENVLTISNIGGKEFKGGKLFYKNRLDDQYLGGITYFVTLPQLEEGYAVQLASSHFEEGRSELLFVTYAE